MTDIQMPGKSGYDLIIEIQKINLDQRFVVVTGEHQAGINKDAPACFYLAKPVNLDKLEAVFQKLLACSEHCEQPPFETLQCKTLNDMTEFNMNDWQCPSQH